MWDQINSFIDNIDLSQKRQLQDNKWMKNILGSLIDQKIHNKPFIKEIENKVNAKELSPFQAAKEIASKILK